MYCPCQGFFETWRSWTLRIFEDFSHFGGQMGHGTAISTGTLKKTGATFNSPQKVNIVIPQWDGYLIFPTNHQACFSNISIFPLSRHLWVLEGLGYEACLWQRQITPRRLHLQPCRCFLRRRFRGRSRGRRCRRRARALLAGFLPGHHGVTAGCDPGSGFTIPYPAW